MFYKVVVALFGLLLLATNASAAELVPNANASFFDSNGNPLAGGFVYMYVPNTTTPKNTWQDPGLTTLNTNPIVLDSSGQARIWAASGAQFRQVVQSSTGDLIWDSQTYVPGGLSSCATTTVIGDAVVWTTTDGTCVGDAGAPPQLRVPTLAALRALTAGVATTVMRTGYNASGDSPPITYTWQASCAVGSPDNRALYVRPNSGGSGCWSGAGDPNTWHVSSWGADSTGVADSTTAMQAMLDALAGGGGTIQTDWGTYKFTGNITYTMTVAYSKLKFSGHGVFKWDLAPGGFVFTINTTASTNSACYTGSIDIDSGVDFYSGVTGTNTAVTISSSTTCSDPTAAPTSNIAASFHGDYETTYWGTALALTKISNVNFTGSVIGRSPNLSSGPGPAGTAISLTGASGQVLCCVNITGANLSGLAVGVGINDYVANVNVVNSNINNFNGGCGISVISTQGGGLNVSNSTFGLFTGVGYGAICVDSAFTDLNIVGNLFVNSSGNDDIVLQNFVHKNVNIANNLFLPSDVTAIRAIYVNSAAGSDFINISGNNFANIGFGVDVAAATAKVNLRSNDNIVSGTSPPVLVENVGASTSLLMPDVTDVRLMGAKCDSHTTDDATAFSTANSLSGMNKIGVFAECRIGSSISIGKPMYIAPLGAIYVDNTFTLTAKKIDVDTTNPFPGAGTVVGNPIIPVSLPANCVGLASGTLYSNAGVVTVCP